MKLSGTQAPPRGGGVIPPKTKNDQLDASTPHHYLKWRNSIIDETETLKHGNPSERQNAHE